jgi:L-aspartate oxidase
MSQKQEGAAAAEVIVVGSGVAGLSVALSLKGHHVLLLTKTRLGEGSSSIWAQGGVAAALGEGDSPALHAQDTLAVGGGIADPAAVAVLTGEGPERIRELIGFGTRFDCHAHGLALGREAAHSRARILHAQGDATGAEMIRALRQAVRHASWIEVIEETSAEDLVVHNQQVIGLVARHGDQGWRFYAAAAVVLATGGVGQLFCYTTNPPEATADGLAMAARAGARLADVEFVQFHPTALATETDPMPLLTEALRGEGAVLVNSAGERFMRHDHAAAELAPRDVVARGIWRQLQVGHKVFLDGRTAIGQPFPERFPTVFAHCQKHGLDPRRDLLPVAPAAHYHMGGVAVDLHGRTSLAHLWACGEVACTGVHGANRLASNSLLEGLVFGQRVGADVRRHLPCRPNASLVQRLTQKVCHHSRRPLTPDAELALKRHLRQLMWENVGLVRTETGLLEALQELRQLEGRYRPACGEVRHLLTVAQLMATAACLRRESRGAHYRADYPACDPDWERHSLWTAVELEAAQWGLAEEALFAQCATSSGGCERVL